MHTARKGEEEDEIKRREKSPEKPLCPDMDLKPQ